METRRHRPYSPAQRDFYRREALWKDERMAARIQGAAARAAFEKLREL